VDRCDYPITASGCTDVVITDLALLRRRDGGFILEEIAAGFTADEVISRTGMAVQVADNPRIMQEQW
jgi:3-oxoacid CoA-transferase